MKSEDDAIIGKQYTRDLAKMRLLYTATDGTSVTAPTFSSTFLDCYRQASAEDNKMMLQQSYAHHCNTRLQSRDYLKRLITCPLMNNSMASYLLRGQNHSHTLDDETHQLDTSILFLSFLPPPVVNTVEEQDNWLKSQQVEETETIVGEHAKKNPV